MLNDDSSGSGADHADARATPAEDSASGTSTNDLSDTAFQESLVEEAAALIDDGKTYLEAELAFQKTRAGIAGKSAAKAAVFAIIAIILLHIAFLALAVGLVIALEPLVTIWGAIGIVFGGLLLLVLLLLFGAARNGLRIAAMFAGDKDKKGEDEQA
ncbi:MAG: hypothetical protein ABJP70_10650 [Erythrobacter sp.]